MRAMNSVASFHTESGDFDAALNGLETIVEECRRMNNRGELSRALCTQAVVMAKLERNGEALELLRAAEATAGEHIAPPLRQSVLMLRALIAIRAGDAADAIVHATKAEALARGRENLVGVAEALRLKAEALRATGDLVAAREATLESIEFLDSADAGQSHEYLKCVTLAARIEHDSGNRAESGFLAEAGESLRAELNLDETAPDPELRHAVTDLRTLLGKG
jgi:tetratricopeptide (TPR) repeat protein